MTRVFLLTPGLFLLFLSTAVGNSGVEFASYLGQTPPGNTKQMFAYGIVSTSLTAHGAMYFTPDGREAYWSVLQEPSWQAIVMECHVESDAWTTPAAMAFSGVYDDNGPFLNADGSRLYFMSIRPETPGGSDGRSFWYVDRLEAGWSEPILLGEPFSSANIGWQGSITANGDIYFVQSIPGQENRDVSWSHFEGGEYQPVERLSPEVNSSAMELAPFVSPDGSYLIFSSMRAGGYGSFDLWVCFANPDGTWNAPQNLGPTVNTGGTENFPSVSPDGEYLFFVASGPGNYDYYWISASVIEDLRPDCCIGRVGDANGLGGDEPTIGDVSVMIDAKFISGTCSGVIDCRAEADINQSGGSDPTCDDITIGDISVLIDYLFITGSSLGLPDCL